MTSVRSLLVGEESGRYREIALCVLLGLVATAAMFFGLSRRGPLIPAIVIAAVPIVAAVVLRPRYAVLLTIFAIGFVEEFRGGIGEQQAGGDEFLRSERTPFYAATIGLPGMYIPDLMILGTVGLFVLRALLQRSPVSFRFDGIGLGLALLGLVLFISMALPLAGPDPFGAMVLDLSTMGSVKLPEKNVADVARYLPMLQYKLFMILFPSYVLGLFYFRSVRDVDQAVTVLGLALVGTIGLGIARVAGDPGMVRKLTPVIFDTGSVALLAMGVFYMVGRWASNHYPPKHAILRAVLCTAMMLLILLSFRRTMWGAIALALFFFPFMLPRHALGRLLGITAVGLVLALLVAVATPPGHALLQSVMSRAAETHLNQPSTLYRFALMVWLVENGDKIPLFGYGLTPLWNEKVYIRFFFTSMENVHSLYMWLLLRLGPVGFLGSMLAVLLILARTVAVLRSTDDERYRIIVGVILLSMVMYLFAGIFNPVYANVRHIVPLGLSLALVTQLPGILARRSEALTPSRPPPDPRAY